MFHSPKIQTLFALGIGALLGFAATSGRFLPRAQAVGAAGQPAKVSHFEQAVLPPTEACCVQAAGAGLLLADASTEIAQAQAGRAKGGSSASAKKPNIVFIMGDDVGWFNIGAYHQGIMSGRTPNLDKLASQGIRFTDYYAEASCTAGRANFITGQLPIRTGLTTVGQAGSPVASEYALT